MLPTELPKPDQITIAQVIDLYLSMGTKDLAAESLRLIRATLKEFRAEFGERRVVDCRAVELLAYMQANEGRWPSAWTRLWRLSAIKRSLNWAVDIGLLSTNPFVRVKVTGPRNRRRPMLDEHYQAILRHSSPPWRRFVVFLRFCGARTIEGSSLRWRHIDIARGVAVLTAAEHKTGKKSGRPRIIPLSPVVIKLLVWMKTHRQASVTGLLEKFLVSGPKRVKEVVTYMRHYGASERAMHVARKSLGVEKVRVGGTGPSGYYEYRLPGDYTAPADAVLNDLVFLTCLGNPLNRHNMALFIGRLRKRGIIPPNVTLYMLRHAYGTRGIKNGVNIKLVSLAMGHASVETTEIYIDEKSLADDVIAAAVQINHGAGARLTTAAAPPPLPPRLIEMPTYGAPIGDMSTAAIFLPSRNGDAPMPVVPLTPPEPVPPPVPVSELDNAGLMRLLLAKLAALEETPQSKRERTVVPPSALTPAQQAAWDAYQWAIAQDPALANAIDADVFAWLKNRVDCPRALPPLPGTFLRYIRAARLLFDCRKRVLHTRTPLDTEDEKSRNQTSNQTKGESA